MNRSETVRLLIPLGIIASSSIAVSSIGVASLYAAFIAALLLGVMLRQFRNYRHYREGWRRRMGVLVTTYGLSWLGSSWWLATGVYSMNQSYWWTGYIAALVAGVWGGLPYSVLSFRLPAQHPILRSAQQAALLSLALHLWPHPFSCSAVIGLASSLPLVQAVEVGGLPLLFFMLYFAGFLASECFEREISPKARAGILVSLGLTFTVWWSAGEYRFRGMQSQSTGTQQISVGVIQPNIPIEGLPPIGPAGDRAQLFEATKSLLASTAATDVVVWPEIPLYFSPTNNPNDQVDILTLVGNGSTPLLLNADMYTNETVHGRVPFYNTEQLFRPGVEKPEEYRKHLLIPIGEYLPFESLISTPSTERFLSGLRRYIPGTELTTFVISSKKGGDVRIGTPICLELMNAELVYRMVTGGAEILVSPANDVYFRTEAAARLGLAFAVIRAVENRAPVVRVTNSGLSSWVSPTGAVATKDTFPSFAPGAGTFRVPVEHPPQRTLSAEARGLLLLAAGLILMLLFSLKRNGVGESTP